MPSPHVRGYSAPQKYARVADLLGLGGVTVQEKVDRLVHAIDELLDRLEIPKSISALGIPREDFETAVPELVKTAFDDPSWRPTNPRMPLMSELAGLLWAAYEGRANIKVQAAGALVSTPG
jgi:acetaldehyde dehydrogenase/alcohol dehydrogenase